MYKSAFCGIIDELPGVFVDNFENAAVVCARAYFLSHCHSDHTQGLFSKELVDTLEVSGACLYMSEASQAIIDNEKTDERIMKYVRPLDMGETTTITLPGDPNQNCEEQYVSVTVIPAGHCFGSVMFLFQTTTKTILYTGDFRLSVNDISKFACFNKNNEPIVIDVMYVDTTFINYSYLNFPKRMDSVEYVVEEIKKWLTGENNGVALHTSAKIGYECIFNEIYKKLGMKIYVNNTRWKFYSKIQHLVPSVTNDENSTKIHSCMNWSEKTAHTKCLSNLSAKTNFLFIHFSAQKWDFYQIDEPSINRISANRLDVCFATHCSRTELLYFVNYFSPKKVVGFPNKFPEKLEPKANKAPPTPVKRKILQKETKISKIKNNKKVDSALLMEMFG